VLAATHSEIMASSLGRHFLNLYVHTLSSLSNDMKLLLKIAELDH